MIADSKLDVHFFVHEHTAKHDLLTSLTPSQISDHNSEYSGFEGATDFAHLYVCTLQKRPCFLAASMGCFHPALLTSEEADSQEPRTLETPFSKPRLRLVLRGTPKIEFKKIPGSPVAYWVSERVREVFEEGTLLGKLVAVRLGMHDSRQRSVLATLA